MSTDKAVPTPQSAGPAGSSGLWERARAGGADTTQLDVLAREDVSYADYEAALSRSFDCMRAAGIEVLEPAPSDASGITLIEYSWGGASGLSEQQAQELGDQCLKRFSYWVEAQYQTQPSSVEAMEKRFLPFRSGITACVRKHGGTIADDAGREEALSASDSVLDKAGFDCFEAAGLGR